MRRIRRTRRSTGAAVGVGFEFEIRSPPPGELGRSG